MTPFLLSNPWRTATLTLAVALALSSAYAWAQGVRVDKATGERDNARASLSAAQSELQAARHSSTEWERTALDLQARLSHWVKQAEADRQAQAQAVERARQRAREADATLNAWLDRYEQATRDAECAQQMRMPLCVR